MLFPRQNPGKFKGYVDEVSQRCGLRTVRPEKTLIESLTHQGSYLLTFQ